MRRRKDAEPPTAEQVAEALARFARIEAAIEQLLAEAKSGKGGSALTRRYKAVNRAFSEIVTSPAFIAAHECGCGHGLEYHPKIGRSRDMRCEICMDDPRRALLPICGLVLKPN